MATYIGCCVHLNGDSINEMKDSSIDIGYDEFVSKVNEDDIKHLFPDYEWGNKDGLNIYNDFCVSFHIGKYEEKDVFYIYHSGIEYIWEV